jgi:TRAP-type C4-dicarboxylate transport system substrate-binding protein
VVINKDVWNGLAPEVQKAMTEVSAEWAGRHGQAWDDSDKEGLEFFLAQEGNAVVTLDPAEAERWSKAMAPIFTAYEAECAKVGVDGKAVLDFMRANLK